MKLTIPLHKVKIGLNIRPEDELYIFVYDKDQVYIPSVSRIYGSDFRKISNASIPCQKLISLFLLKLVSY